MRPHVQQPGDLGLQVFTTKGCRQPGGYLLYGDRFEAPCQEHSHSTLITIATTDTTLGPSFRPIYVVPVPAPRGRWRSLL